MALGIIMIPIVARTSEEVLRLVPKELREASLALGATESRTILRVVVPAAQQRHHHRHRAGDGARGR